MTRLCKGCLDDISQKLSDIEFCSSGCEERYRFMPAYDALFNWPEFSANWRQYLEQEAS